jgi:arginyl-tRNA synthetase
MSAEIKSHLTELLTRALAKIAPQQPGSLISLERPKQARHGDFSCPAAMQLARILKRNPRELAIQLVEALPQSDWLERAEVAGSGFINLRVRPAAKQHIVKTIFAEGERYGRSERGQGRRVIVEFVSANPTGPLHVGHGRQAAIGDAVSALLESQGWSVTREFYYNDAGVQIRNLGLSVQARIREKLGLPAEFPADGYHGDYVREIAENYLGAGNDGENLNDVMRFAVAELRREQDLDLQAFSVRFDSYHLESSLYSDGRVQRTVHALIAAGKTFEQEGALWLRTTDYGDDKDRVVRKSDGNYTYFVPDIAYHLTKWERGFTRAINIQGSDHHGTVTRVRAGLQAVSSSWEHAIPRDYPEYVLHKMVTVMKGGEEMKISKRAGSYVTLRELLDEVGSDATRLFLVSRKADTEFVFDVDLATSQSDENPVYYLQYAHARICSLLEQWRVQFPEEGKRGIDAIMRTELEPLTEGRELELLQRLGEYPEMLENACVELAPHQIVFYLRELAREFHSYYNAERILVSETPLRTARISLCLAVRQVLRNGLSLLSVSQPEKM